MDEVARVIGSALACLIVFVVLGYPLWLLDRRKPQRDYSAMLKGKPHV